MTISSVLCTGHVGKSRSLRLLTRRSDGGREVLSEFWLRDLLKSTIWNAKEKVRGQHEVGS